MNSKNFKLFPNNDNTITCPEFEKIAEQIELSEGKPAEEILEHIQKCPDCREYFSFWQDIENVIQQYHSQPKKETISEWERQKSIHHIKQSIQKDRQRKKVLLWSVLSIAAGIVFLMLAIFYLIPDSQPPSVQAVEQNITPPPTTIEHTEGATSHTITPVRKIPDKDM